MISWKIFYEKFRGLTFISIYFKQDYTNTFDWLHIRITPVVVKAYSSSIHDKINNNNLTMKILNPMWIGNLGRHRKTNYLHVLSIFQCSKSKFICNPTTMSNTEDLLSQTIPKTKYQFWGFVKVSTYNLISFYIWKWEYRMASEVRKRGQIWCFGLFYTNDNRHWLSICTVFKTGTLLFFYKIARYFSNFFKILKQRFQTNTSGVVETRAKCFCLFSEEYGVIIALFDTLFTSFVCFGVERGIGHIWR